VNATSPLAALARRSVAVIRANQAMSGAYLASPNFAVYRYSWFRDGAFIADAMSRAGHAASAEAFFRWCSGVLEARAAKIDTLIERHRTGQVIGPEEFLHARYTVEGDEVAQQWWNFQLDGYGTWLWALASHVRRTNGASLDAYRRGIILSVRYLAEFWNEPSYDGGKRTSDNDTRRRSPHFTRVWPRRWTGSSFRPTSASRPARRLRRSARPSSPTPGMTATWSSGWVATPSTPAWSRARSLSACSNPTIPS